MLSADARSTSRARAARPLEGSLRARVATRTLGALLVAASCALFGCEPKLIVGQRTCTDSDASASIPAQTDPIAVPWSTSVENGFCDYTQLAGFCFADTAASYEIVTSPVHSGEFAAAFSVTTADPTGYQTRCVRQGALPNAAYYGAWYYVPALATNSALWNLLHFQGGDTSAQHGLWDVSLSNAANGDLQLFVFDFLDGATLRPANLPPIPIASWFHIEFYLERAADATGKIALYQDGQLLLDASGLITDDSSWGQWYVGNVASGLNPPESTLYVDDVSIDTTL
jgi:hypothetical protein